MTPLDLRLETQRLILRAPIASDAPDLARWCADWDIARWTANIVHPYTLADAEAYITKARDALSEARMIPLLVERRAAPGVIGGIGLVLDGPGKEADMGWWIGVPFQGQGYACEGGAAVIELARAMEMVRLSAGILPDNLPSQNVARKLGFRPDGKCLREAPARGGPRETLEFALTLGHSLAS